ncbi:hypothetical protein [Aquimarina intermedia]|uniref:Bacteriophage CI repressor-like protein n=1 Tax=Aquimarina intermedia TaxID=350814 RepID=A0A5S5C2A2_9FLAO|nr:hypothetical protein [Aquimarina intermedia]TYP73444.1 hypothetical protein BD809_10531 [Aquimarina intermedia]
MDKKDNILDRVIIFAEYLGYSLRSFSLSIEASPGYLHRLQSSNSNIGGDFIERIIATYEQLNPLWLLTGKGDMLLETHAIGVNESEALYGKRDFLKEALLVYLDDEDIKNKIKDIVTAQQIEE